MLNRRSFIKKSVVLAAASAIPSSSMMALADSSREIKITILHTNDWHSRIEAFPMDGGKYQGLGGAAARKKIIDQVRKEQAHVLLLDCGDVFQGTPYFNFFNGNLEIELMNEMGYDASTIGNHEFDAGMENLAAAIDKAKFPFLSCNYHVEKTPLKQKLLNTKIFQFDKIKIGVFGVGIDPEGLVPAKLCQGVEYADPISKAEEISFLLKKNMHCDYVICLSHLGYEYDDSKVSDHTLAQNTSYIDMILGGHTHTFLDSPILLKNKLKKEVLVNQVGWAGIHLGRIDLIFNHKKWVRNTMPKKIKIV